MKVGREIGYTFGMAETIGVFGGTFDPPHLGHLILAGEAFSQLQLDRLLWVLTPDPPHKPLQPVAVLRHRREMLTRAIANVPNFELSTVEIDREGPHYTADTLDILQQRLPLAKLVLLIGADSLENLPKWFHPREIVTSAYALGVMRRPGVEINFSTLEEKIPGISNKVRFIDTPQLEISSSTIRERIATGGHYRFYLHPGVYDYIQQHLLYRPLFSDPHNP